MFHCIKIHHRCKLVYLNWKINETVLLLHQPVRHHIIQIIDVLLYIVCVFGRFLEMLFLHDWILYGMTEEILEIILYINLVQFLMRIFFSFPFCYYVYWNPVVPKMVVHWIFIWTNRNIIHRYFSIRSIKVVDSLAGIVYHHPNITFLINHKIKI